jgi:hypothetical protein
VLYLTRGLLNVLQQYTWEPTSNARCVVYLHVLDMLSAAAQEVYPYHVEKGNSLSLSHVQVNSAISLCILFPLVSPDKNKKKQTPWSESASELYRPSDRRLSTK